MALVRATLARLVTTRASACACRSTSGRRYTNCGGTNCGRQGWWVKRVSPQPRHVSETMGTTTHPGRLGNGRSGRCGMWLASGGSVHPPGGPLVFAGRVSCQPRRPRSVHHQCPGCGADFWGSVTLPSILVPFWQGTAGSRCLAPGTNISVALSRRQTPAAFWGRVTLQKTGTWSPPLSAVSLGSTSPAIPYAMVGRAL